MSIMDFMKCSFVPDKDQLIHLSGSLINGQNDQGLYQLPLYQHTLFKNYTKFHHLSYSTSTLILVMWQDKTAALTLRPTQRQISHRRHEITLGR
jgi:hypothetical protein